LDTQELLEKLAQIQEQAQRTLSEFPRTLTQERLRMIIALTRYLRTELSYPRAAAPLAAEANERPDDLLKPPA
jgi:hypothetical protein